tara:strand:+ start:433 stop:798 length:366 start_codon:yes stop_codon:yes gene_type:complete
MIILTTNTTAQDLSIIPRTYISTFTVEIRDDSTNVIVDYLITNATTIGNYLTFSNIFVPVLVEGHFYDLQIFSDASKTNTIYRDRIFCTDQDINQTTNNHYKLNKGEYTEYNGFNNDYIVI